MNKSVKTDQQTFLHVKQRLDFYRLPSKFPIEATSLLSRLLELIDANTNEKIYQKENLRYAELKAENQACCTDSTTSSFSPLVDAAVKHELSKHIKQNNELHTTIMSLKEELWTLKHVESKSKIENLTLKNTQHQQDWLLEDGLVKRERQLMEELEDVKYKYNQLLEIVYSDDNTDREYIKKLLKHKNYCSEGGREGSGSKGKTLKRSRGVTTNGFGTRQQQWTSSGRKYGHSQQASFLREKLTNRQEQIKRLHKKLQFDGINMNRILKEFNESQAKQQRAKVNERVELLEKSSHQQKQQNAKMKREGGDKQALREHVARLKEQNAALNHKLQAMKKKNKESENDEKNHRKQSQRKLNQTTGNLENLIKLKTKHQFQNQQLKQNSELLQSQLLQLYQQLQNLQNDHDQLLLRNQQQEKQLEDLKPVANKYKNKNSEIGLANLLKNFNPNEEGTYEELYNLNKPLLQAIEKLQKAANGVQNKPLKQALQNLQNAAKKGGQSKPLKQALEDLQKIANGDPSAENKSLLSALGNLYKAVEGLPPRENKPLLQALGNLDKVFNQALEGKSQPVDNNNEANQEAPKRNSLMNESTNIVDRTVENTLLNQFYKNELAETKNKLYSKDSELIKKQNDCLTLSFSIEKLKKQLDYLRVQNSTLRPDAMRAVQLQIQLQQLVQELHSQKDLFQIERAKVMKSQAQLNDYDKISVEFLTLKEQYFTLQKGQKDRIRSLELRIAEFEEFVNLKVLKLEEKDIRINSLENQLIDSSQKLRKTNREMSLLDEQTHKLKIEKNRLQKKHWQLMADVGSKKQSENNHMLLKESQLLLEIEKMNREVQRYRLMGEEKEVKAQQLGLRRAEDEQELEDMERVINLQREEIENHKQRQQLYEMEIKELKEIADTR